MPDNMLKVGLGLSITLLVLSIISMMVVEKASAEYYILIISMAVNIIFSVVVFSIECYRNKNK